MNKIFVFVCIVLLSVTAMQVMGACPKADLNGDCKVNLEDFAVMASQWLDIGEPLPILNGMTWVSINDPGVDDTGDGIPDHEGFTGEMGKYETTNAQYCQFLNAALASGDITISEYNTVYGANGDNSGTDFVSEPYYSYAASGYSQITYTGGIFNVRSRDGYDMSNHPVVGVSWYGATAFCSYYGYRLPTDWEWQAVADYDGSYIYGCGTTINQSKANYGNANPLGLSSYPYTSPVNHYLSYGYGMNDMAGNAWEWTSTPGSGGIHFNDGTTNRVVHGGCWGNVFDSYCAVSELGFDHPGNLGKYGGFRVCR